MVRINCSFLIVVIICVFFIAGCGVSNSTLATFGDEKITLKEFEESCVKNYGNWDSCATSTLEERKEYLDLLLKFRMKVKEAYARGLDKKPEIRSEIDSNNQIVAQTYIIEKEVYEPGLKKYYDRRSEELRASHILIQLRRGAKPDDTLEAYKRAVDIISKLKSIPFDTLAYNYSEDPSAKTNYGDLGYFTAGRMVPEFEDACYSLKVGEYTKKPVRTTYGYHIIKLTDRRPNRGYVRLSHIIVKFDESANDSVAKKDTAWMIYEKLKSGGNFSDLVKAYSEDRITAMRDGDLGYYEYVRIPQNLADDFYKMPVGWVSEPVKFTYGYQIFKITDKKPIPSFDESKKDIREQYQQYLKTDYQNYLNNLKVKYEVSIDSATVIKALSYVDSTKRIKDETWRESIPYELLNKPVITSKNVIWTTQKLFEEGLKNDETKLYQMNRNNTWLLIKKLIDKVVLENHVKNVAGKYPALNNMLKEFEEGILLFHIEQEEVWKKVVVNDSVLKEYYELHKDNYRWPNRVNFAEIFVLSDSAAKAIYKKLKKGKDFMAMAEECTNRAGYKDKKGEWGLKPFDYNELSRKASTMPVGGISEPFKYENGWSIVKNLAIDSARVKTFEEAMPEVASAYQDEASKKREQEFVEFLKQKYPIKINEEVISRAFARK